MGCCCIQLQYIRELGRLRVSQTNSCLEAFLGAVALDVQSLWSSVSDDIFVRRRVATVLGNPGLNLVNDFGGS